MKDTRNDNEEKDEGELSHLHALHCTFALHCIDSDEKNPLQLLTYILR